MSPSPLVTSMQQDCAPKNLKMDRESENDSIRQIRREKDEEQSRVKTRMLN